MTMELKEIQRSTGQSLSVTIKSRNIARTYMPFLNVHRTYAGSASWLLFTLKRIVKNLKKKGEHIRRISKNSAKCCLLASSLFRR
jgi:hypothetical protein